MEKERMPASKQTTEEQTTNWYPTIHVSEGIPSFLDQEKDKAGTNQRNEAGSDGRTGWKE